AGGAAAGVRVDVPGGHGLPVEGAGAARHHADHAVVLVRDDQVARGVCRHSHGAVELGAGGGAAVAGQAGASAAGGGVDVPGGHGLPVEGAGLLGHDPDPVVPLVGDQQVAGSIYRHPGGGSQPGHDGPATVTAATRSAGPGDRVDIVSGHRPPVEGAAAGRYHPNPAVERV